MNYVKNFKAFINEGAQVSAENLSAPRLSGDGDIVNRVYKEGLKVPSELFDDGAALPAKWFGFSWNGEFNGKTYVWDLSGVQGVPSMRGATGQLPCGENKKLPEQQIKGIDVYAGVAKRMTDADPKGAWLAWVSIDRSNDMPRFHGYMLYMDKNKKAKCLPFDTAKPYK